MTRKPLTVAEVIGMLQALTDRYGDVDTNVIDVYIAKYAYAQRRLVLVDTESDDEEDE